MNEVVDRHYRSLAQRYDRYLCYSPEFIRALSKKMIERLALQPDDVLVDLGCGTGLYSRDILAQLPLRNEVIGVDPFPEMLRGIPADARIRPVEADALGFSELDLTYDKVLMKEAIHHVDRRRELFENLRERLRPGGRLLLVHVPPKLRYPLFQRALERCERWHADPGELEQLLLETGYRVERDGLDYLHRIPKEIYFSMVEGRYMSVLSSFSDEEIQEGIEEMRRTYADMDMLEFVDHFDYITGIVDGGKTTTA